MNKTRAIVLHRFAYSDSSFIVKALTEECGVVSFIVKGGKRKESPFKGALDPLALSEVVFRQNPSTELQFIKEASVIDWHASLRQSLLNLAEAQVMAEMVLRYAPPGAPLVEEFTLLDESLKALDMSDTNPKGFLQAGCYRQANIGAISLIWEPVAVAKKHLLNLLPIFSRNREC